MSGARQVVIHMRWRSPLISPVMLVLGCSVLVDDNTMFHSGPGGVDDDNDEEYGCYHSAAAFPSNNTMNGDSLQIEQANRVRRQSIALQLVSQTCPRFIM